MHATFTKLQDGQILDTFYSLFSNMIITRKYIPEVDEDGDFCAPLGKKIVIDKIASPTKNIYLIYAEIEKRHKQILKTINQ